MMKTILIEYTLSEAAKIEDVESHIGEFVKNISDLKVGIRYVSHRKRDVARSYVHVGFIPSDAALSSLQAASFFKPFAEYLKSVCREPPRSTWLETVAITDG
jgi:hypothetical protein